MDRDLSSAFFGVYCSSREILKNNQRHLFCSMLDLLLSTCKTTNNASSKVSTDNLIDFWLSDILPLTFDEDPAIQKSAFDALEQGLQTIKVEEIHRNPHWLQMKNSITTIYAPRLHKMRNENNQFWHRIWCLLIRILDREILKGASTINSFLSIVELGFRSNANSVRAEAFVCWRTLIQIFHVYGELMSPKRLKLICIPLKSSQPKSIQTAAMKLRVWWYLLVCFEKNIDHYFDKLVEPFLSFMFGATGKSSSCVAQQFTSVRMLALLCISSLMSTASDPFLELLMRENQLELLSLPSPLVTCQQLEKNWRPFVSAAIEAIRLLIYAEKEITENEQRLLNIILGLSLNMAMKIDYGPCCSYLCKELATMALTHPRPLVFSLNTIAAEGLVLNRSLKDIENYSEIVHSLTLLITQGKPYTPPVILYNCIDRVICLDAFSNSPYEWEAMVAVINIILKSDDEENYEAYETKLLIWCRVSHYINIYYREKGHNKYSTDDDAKELITNWIVWPLRLTAAFAGKRTTSSFDTRFCELWRKMLYIGMKCLDTTRFLCQLKQVLEDLAKSRREEIYFAEFFDAYVSVVLQLKFKIFSVEYRCLFELFQKFLNFTMPQKTVEACLNTIRNVINTLQPEEITKLFDVLKLAFNEVLRNVTNGHIEASIFEDWKRGILEKIQMHPNKKFSAELKEILNANQVFVIIPSVWSLNPEKLTDRQKERFAERSDIPALYNDISQSQDTSMKPWTPKKIVLVKGDQTEISITNVKQKKYELGEETTNNLIKSSMEIGNVENSPCATQMDNKEGSEKDIYPLEKEVTEALYDDEQPTTTTRNLNNQKSNRYSMRRFMDREDKNNTQLSTEDSNNIYAKVTIPTRDRKLCNKQNKQFSDELNNKNSQGEEFKTNAKQETCGELGGRHENNKTDIIAAVESTLKTHEKSEHSRDTSSETQMGKNALLDHSENTNDVRAEQLDQDLLRSNTACLNMAQIIQVKETSPVKMSSKFIPLLSPPDRKLTNNSNSPTLRPKPSAHLTGRGASMINMIRNKKNETTQFGVSSKIYNLKSDKGDMVSVSDLLELTEKEHVLTPVQSKNLLTFSKPLPSPTASPSGSILKRRLREDSIDDISVDSPACKRKRVSFQDPPVSGTKEYLRDSDENKTKRCLILDKNISLQAEEKMLKRRNKIETNAAENEKHSTPLKYIKSNEIFQTHREIISSESSYQTAHCDTKGILSLDTDKVLDYIVEHCSLDFVLSKYFSVENTVNAKTPFNLIKFLSNLISTDNSFKEKILGTLSENFSKDFLDHAVQENLSSVVCDRLNLNSVIDYICAKSKINTICRNNLLSHIPDILNQTKLESERINFIKNLLQTSNFTDENIVDVISLLVQKRCGSRVSESAIDSSSNL